MAGWKANLSVLNLQLGRTRDQIDKVLLDSTKEGARVWLREVLSIIPTWSGASRATFEALAQAVEFKVVYGPIRSFTDRRGLGQGTGFGGIRKIGQTGGYEFYYRTDLRYLIFNEANVATVGVAGVFKGLINPTPYHFFERGQQAFFNYAKTVRLPGILITQDRI